MAAAIGFAARLLVYASMFLALWIFRPNDISEVPFAQLTLADVGKTVAWIGVALLLVRALFNPSDEEIARDGWGGVGLLILAAFVLGGVYLYAYGGPR